MIAFIFCLCFQDDPVKDRLAAEALARFQAAWEQTREPALRVAAMEELSKVQHPRVLSTLAGHLSGGHIEVRRGAARVLGRWKELKPEVSRALLGALPAAGKEPDLVADLLDSLGYMGERSAAPAIIARLDDRQIPVTLAALRAATKVRTREMVDPLVRMALTIEQAIAAADPRDSASYESRRRKAQEPLVQAALKAITKQDAPAKAADWAKWWKENRETFKVEE